METKELIQELRSDAEWAHANEWETPIMLGDHLNAAADRLAAHEDTGLTPEEVAHAKDLLAAEKDGRLVTLPDCSKCAYQQNGNISLACGNCIGGQGLDNDLFTPRAEAEAALKESNSTSLKPEAANG